MKNLTAILVDDYSPALEMLENDLSINHPEIEIIAKGKSVVEASKLLRQQEPDILFLDIMLGDGTGFDVLEIHPNLSSKIIFVTASDEYAIKAFKFAAIDYILKPYSSEDLSNAIKKAKSQISPNKEQLSVLQDSISYPNQRPKKISLNSSDKIIVVNLDDIMHCKSDNNYTEFFMNDTKKILVGKTLKYFSDILKEYNFLRVHQSHLINLQFVKEFIKSDGGYIVLQNNQSIPVSVRKKNEVIEALQRI
ncbi:two component transcriptional regulator, LytTR family [Tenacibaculum sp. MAR_2009_124]|uniref:LytR/AlgR family response regulator transcription factor n=1 Tax=Tenacibaculum sp. MAR_2009_124 TaxID=1250059 RepID=UPI000897AA38|nr:LytTR family DNA-binding domain-containing protein [Tenacibaculum sp. MAR_2009_124]SEB36203.1 two component transcriptional regulator, LytTR family [Tenacibaculum sp. MAR_2009_124]